jgi:hypothetical protein
MPSDIDFENRFPRLAIVFAVSAVLAGPAQAQTQPAQIYRCQGADGVVEYSNSPVANQPGRSCKAIEISPITTIPAPKLPARAGKSGGSSATGDAAGTKPGAAGAKSAAADGFPHVDPATQKSRDSDRKRILEDEQRKEESKLAELRKEYNNGEPERQGNERNYQKYLDRVQRLKEDIARSESNLASIQRELASIRD